MLDPGERRFSRLWRDPRWQVVAAVLAVTVVVAVAAPHLPGRAGLIGAGGAGPHAASKGETSGTAGARPGPVNATPIPPTPEQVAISTRVPAKLAAALATWNSGPGGSALQEIANDVGAALQSGGMKFYATMRSACGSLATAVSPAGTGPPIPDVAMQSKYSAALSALAKAAVDCRAAISVQQTGESVVGAADPAALHLAQGELGNGITSLADLRIVIDAATAGG